MVATGSRKSAVIFLTFIVSVWDSGPSPAGAALGLQPHCSADALLSSRDTAWSTPSHPWPRATVAAHGDPRDRKYACPRRGSFPPRFPWQCLLLKWWSVAREQSTATSPAWEWTWRAGFHQFCCSDFIIKVQRSVNEKLMKYSSFYLEKHVHNWPFNLGSLGNHWQRNHTCLGSPVVSSGGGRVRVAAWRHSLRGIGLNRVLMLAL